jgi:hypothetical protein
LNTDETQILKKKSDFATETQRRRERKRFLTSVSLRLYGQSSICEIEIRAAHEIMAARTTQLALLVDQLMSALQAITPMLAGKVFSGNGTGILTKIVSGI